MLATSPVQQEAPAAEPAPEAPLEVVNMMVNLSLGNLHEQFALANGLLVVVDGQEVQRPPPFIPNGQSINGQFTITWTISQCTDTTMMPLGSLLIYEIVSVDGEPILGRPHLIVGWRVNISNTEAGQHGLTSTSQFFARIVGEHLAFEIVNLWRHTDEMNAIHAPDSVEAIMEKDRFFTELADTALHPAGASSRERRVLANGSTLIVSASLTNEETAPDADVPGVSLNLQISLEPE
jgi:hypothetical protein